MTTLTLALLTLIACGDKDDDTGAGEFDAILALTGDAAAGATVFSSTCANCHGADGTGGSAPDISGAVGGYSDADLLDVVLNGSGSMAPVALEDQEAADLLAYVRDTF